MEKKIMIEEEIILSDGTRKQIHQEHTIKEETEGNQKLDSQVTEESVDVDFSTLQSETFIPNEPLPDYDIKTSKDWTAWFGWGLFVAFGLLLFTLLSFYDLAMSLFAMYQESPIFAYALAFIALVFSALLIWLLYREISSYLHVNSLGTLQKEFSVLSDQEDPQQLLKFIQKISSRQNSMQANNRNQEFFSLVKPHHTQKEIFQLYQDTVQTPLEKEAKQILYSELKNSGGAALISINPLMQMVLSIWINTRILRKIANLYGIRPGVTGTLKLLIIVTQNSIVQYYSDEVYNSTIEGVVSEKLGIVVGKVSNKFSQAILAAALSYRFGRALIKLVKFELKN